MEDDKKGKIEKFYGNNFLWIKMQMEDYLYQKNIYLSLIGERLEKMTNKK